MLACDLKVTQAYQGLRSHFLTSFFQSEVKTPLEQL